MLERQRAIAAFHKVGLNLVPAAEYDSVEAPEVENLLDFLPNAEALAWTTSAIKEIIGLEYYRLRGWA